MPYAHATPRPASYSYQTVGQALADLGPPAHTFVCGSNPFVSAASDLLVDAGVPAATIRTERFGGQTP